MERKTPLYGKHVSQKGKMVPFAGYLLPVQYEGGVIAEHMAVRQNCGLFDVSHMGEFICRGKDAARNLNYLLTNDFTKMYDGQARYSPMCNEKGGIVDDLIVYKIKEDDYFIVVNAANRERDFTWMSRHRFGDVQFIDISDSTALIALQGPKAKAILKKAVSEDDIPKKYYSANFKGRINEIPCTISKTGYTGEDGFEFYCSPEDAPKIWELFLELGSDKGIMPCGLGARDTLRLEAAMPLYGNEMNEEVTPYEAGLLAFVKMEKEDFIGKKALLEKADFKRCRMGLKVTGRGIIREHADIYREGKLIGKTTSGTYSPLLQYSIAMALLDRNAVWVGDEVEADVRGRRVKAQVVELPFYKKNR
ncbi:glycine cleavage system aminomethyltransferase GcvT [uncultured Robinsoniella sp.]|uniref:glycine cleavage system aminomethyltransferase GcvT n=1 Tax=uncultured Robinsoniella sp. TaxID=904190 RepID=UPI00374E51ED